MAKTYLMILLVVGGLLVAGATADVVVAGRYDLLFGPGELAKSIFFLGDLVDDRMGLQTALVREYGSANIGQAIDLLTGRYNATYPVTIPKYTGQRRN